MSEAEARRMLQQRADATGEAACQWIHNEGTADETDQLWVCLPATWSEADRLTFEHSIALLTKIVEHERMTT